MKGREKRIDRIRYGTNCVTWRREGVINIQRGRNEGRARVGGRERGWLVLTPVIVLMYDLI